MTDRGHRFATARQVATVITLLGCGLAWGQAVTLDLKLQSIGGIRVTNPNFGSTYTPYWHVAGDPQSPITTDAPQIIRNTAFSYSLEDRSSAEAGSPAGVLSYSDVSGTYPDGITRTAGVISGTATTVETDTPVVRVTFTPTVGTPTTADLTITLDVIADPDGVAPSVPAGVTATALSSTELLFAWQASSDGSGVLSYDVSSSGNESTCTSQDNNLVVVNSPTVQTTRTGLTASEDYWVKVRARDNSAAQNVSAWSACVAGTTSAAGGGLTLLVDNGFENYATGDLHPILPDGFYTDSTAGTGTLEVSTTHAREGTKSLRTRISKSGTTNYRQEVRLQSALEHSAIDASESVCYGVSVYIPSSSSLISNSAFVQWHITTQDISSSSSPILGLRIVNGNWTYTREVGTFSGGTIGAVATNEWTDWALKIKWRQDTTGAIAIYKNGTLIVNLTNLITAQSQEETIGFFKMGRYSSSWKQSGNGDANGTIHETWHDSLKIVQDDACTVADVTPSGSRLSAP